MAFEYERYELMVALSGSISQFFFQGVTGQTTSIELRERAEAMGVMLGRIEAVVAQEGPVGPSIADEIRRLEEQIVKSVRQEVSAAIRPGGSIFRMIEGGRK